MVKDRESLIGVDKIEDHFAGIDEVGRIQILNGGELPFADHPGEFLPKDTYRDKMLLESLRHVGNGKDIKKGAKLDYEQSKALYETVRGYFENTDPLMNTERWMAEYVERNGITYTDHDGKRYIMKGGVRKKIK